MASPLVIAKTPDRKTLALLPAMGNRHGLITGATGTGKTVTMQVIAESFSRIGVATFMADVKGDVSGIAKAGDAVAEIAGPPGRARSSQPRIGKAARSRSGTYRGERGHPVRTTVSDMGPLLLGRLLNLNDVQRGAPR